MKNILKQILLDFINDGILYNTCNADWKGLEKLVKEQGLNKNSNYDDIKSLVLHIFEEQTDQNMLVFKIQKNWLGVE